MQHPHESADATFAHLWQQPQSGRCARQNEVSRDTEPHHVVSRLCGAPFGAWLGAECSLESPRTCVSAQLAGQLPNRLITMNQPDSPTPRSTRPQLFSAPNFDPESLRQPDERTGILATIDCERGRNGGGDGKASRQATWWVLGSMVLLLGAAGMAWVHQVESSRGALREQTVVASAPLSVAGLPADGSASAAAGAAVIETVSHDAPPLLRASFPYAASNLSAALSKPDSPQSATDQSDPVVATDEGAAITKPQEAAKPGDHTIRTASARAMQVKATPRSQPVVTGRKASSQDTDAELLAAMLPHLRRTKGVVDGPTSPAHQRRCGHVADAAVAACRVRFCNGRGGQDGACPSGEGLTR